MRMLVCRYCETHMSEKIPILIVSSYYLPGGTSAGGTRTIVNTVERLSDEFDFHIITRGRDVSGDSRLYEGVKLGEWTKVGSASVFYLRSDLDIFRFLGRAIDSTRPRLVYFNSFFSTLSVFGATLRRLRRSGNPPFIIAPCGEFAPSALAMKRFKKSAYLRFAKLLGLYRGVVWRASTEREARDIRDSGLETGMVRIAPDLPARQILPDFDIDLKPSKRSGKLRLVFLSRIDRIKNLDWFLEQLKFSGGAVELDVFGGASDRSYMSELILRANSGGHGIEVRFKGEVPNSQVPDVLFSYDFMVLPTLGENFAHVVLESLASGCPPIISDRTPWLDLEQSRAGWALPLEDRSRWQQVLDECIGMENGEYRMRCAAARSYAVEFLEDPKVEAMTREMLTLSVA